MGKARFCLVTALIAGAPVLAPMETRPGFEVASIKVSPAASDRSRAGGDIIAMPGGGLKVVHKTLREMIGWAYFSDCDNCGDLVSGGPAWMDSVRYDIEARPVRSADKSDRLTPAERRKQSDRLLRQRGQTLLEDRFQLVVRREAKAGPSYALRVANNGHKLQPGTGQSAVKGGDDVLTGENATMEELATSLASVLGRPVVDKTGLTGGFNFKLEWTPV